MKRWLPLTYGPKIAGVLDGTIRQTIRKGCRYWEGDEIAFHGWSGKPYRSPWSFRTGYYPLKEVYEIDIRPDGILIHSMIEKYVVVVYPWEQLDEIAGLDGIDPPTGEALRDVLLGMGCTGSAQILRW